MPRNSRLALAVASGLAATALVAACGSSGSSPTGQPSNPPASSAPAAPSSPSTGTPSTPNSGKPALMTTTTTSLGTVVTDGNGFTLYRFDKDTASPSMSNCTGTCASTWPPALAGGDTSQLKGIDSKLVSTVTRSDGSKQLTLNGWPLYRYGADSKPGDTKGQGVMGIWFAATPTGGKATAASQPASPSTGGGGYGY
ncbi:hypothetical protein [Kitasatospora cinereorecta]|uniref:Lipoprotein n=1 Tax=Kitasatospora cinereorecta TaxID=285560 RepID=A0ABW0VPT6_9ACTN